MNTIVKLLIAIDFFASVVCIYIIVIANKFK
jgi:hypothetical protein